MKTHLSIVFFLMLSMGAWASVYDSIGYPDHVIARQINADGQITAEYGSDFNYKSDGELDSYSYFNVITAQFGFQQYPDMPLIINMLYHSPEFYLGQRPPGPVQERVKYRYENNLLVHKEDRKWSDYETYFSYNWNYFYHNYRLIQEETNGLCHVYSYENDFKIRIDHCFLGFDYTTLNSLTTNHYNDLHQLLTSEIENYDNAGNLTSKTLKTYTYTPQCKSDSVITQTYCDGMWMNSELVHYVYDDKNRIIEYQTGIWSVDDAAWIITKKTIYDFNDELQTLTISFRKKSEDEWVWDVFSNQSLFNDSRLSAWQHVLVRACSYSSNKINQFEFSMHYDELESTIPFLSEWYYEILNDDGSVTYQHLQYTEDTVIGNDRPKVIVRTNQIYDKDSNIEVTHEYIKEENNKVYWWNKELQAFTTLYDYAANAGDEWEIEVGAESITVHVDSVGVFEYGGTTRKVLHVSDVGNVFGGDIVVGFGHLTSFFPEKLMNRNANFIVSGLRCYWVGDALLYHNCEEGCNAVHSVINTVNETNTKSFSIYPNPVEGSLTIEMHHGAPLQEYRITNMMGQVLLQGALTDEIQQINMGKLPSGMYFISVDGQTLKIMVR